MVKESKPFKEANISYVVTKAHLVRLTAEVQIDESLVRTIEPVRITQVLKEMKIWAQTCGIDRFVCSANAEFQCTCFSNQRHIHVGSVCPFLNPWGNIMIAQIL